MIARVVQVEPTDPVVELPCQARQCPRGHPKQRVDLVRRQLESDVETGTGRVPKEPSPKTRVRQQTTECAFHVSLTHASSRQARIAPRVFLGSRGSFGAASHAHV
jgi:hypothetical protein